MPAPRPRALGALAVFLAAVLSAAPAAARLVDRVGLIINQDSVTAGELTEAIEAYFGIQGRRPPDSDSPEYRKARKEIVNSIVEEYLLAQEADRQKIEVSEGELNQQVDAQMDAIQKRFPSQKEFEAALAQQGLTAEDLRADNRVKLTRQIKSTRALRFKEQEMKDEVYVSDEDAKAYFQKHVSDFDQAKISVIFFQVPEGSKADYAAAVKVQAEKALEEIRGGADFEAYARKYSEDPGSAERGGDMGTVFRYQLEKSMAQGVFAIPAKDMGVVATREGVYAVKVQSKKKASYETALADVKQFIKRQKQGTGIKDWLETLKKRAYIKELK